MEDCWHQDPQGRPVFNLIIYKLESLVQSKLVSYFKTLHVTVYLVVFLWFVELH